MKKLIALLVIATSMNTFAGSVINTKTGEELNLECTKFDDQNQCTHFNIVKTDSEHLKKQVIAKSKVHRLTNTKDEFLFREFTIGELQLAPVTRAAYNTSFPIVPPLSAFAMIGTIVVGVINPVVLPVMLAGTAGIVIAPVAIDIASLPFRALVKGAKIRHANQSERFAFEALYTMLDENNENLEMSHRKFNRAVEAFAGLK